MPGSTWPIQNGVHVFFFMYALFVLFLVFCHIFRVPCLSGGIASEIMSTVRILEWMETGVVKYFLPQKEEQRHLQMMSRNSYDLENHKAEKVN